MSVLTTAIVVALAATAGVLIGAVLTLILLIKLTAPPRKE